VRAAIKAAARGDVKAAGLEHPARRREHDMSADLASSLPRGVGRRLRQPRRRFHLPFAGRAEAQSTPAAASATPEINAWVVVQPDDYVVIRIARSEMGQGTLTGLAQLVAEELECDWSKVRTEWPTPGQNLARNRGVGQLLDRRAAAASATRTITCAKAARRRA
jgi:CO/xanthine dehydrogenase Mo-binding subunit